MSSWVVSKWHINRLSGNHKQGDYKKTTEYLDSHTVNTVDLLMSESVAEFIAKTDDYGYVDGSLALDGIYFNTTYDIDKIQPLLDKVIAYTYNDNADYPHSHYVSGFYSFPHNGIFKLQYCWGNVTNDCYYVFSNNNTFTSRLITIGTGDLEIVIDEVEAMPA